jgi:hypothetical protein
MFENMLVIKDLPPNCLKVVIICEVWTIVHHLSRAKNGVFQFDEAWLGNWEHNHVTWYHTWVSQKEKCLCKLWISRVWTMWLSFIGDN